MVLSNADLRNILYQAGVYSRVLRTNFENLKNAHNDLESRFAAALTEVEGASEVVDARDHAAILTDRLRQASKANGNVVIEGLDVAPTSPASMQVKVSAGDALIDGVYCMKAAETTMGALVAPAANTRYDVVVLNSDNTLSIVDGGMGGAGLGSANPVLPAIAITQRALAIITLTSSTTSITAANIRMCKRQGAELYDNSGTVKYYWRISDALTDASAGSRIEVGEGFYYEFINGEGYSDITINFGSAKLYRVSAGDSCLSFSNPSTETNVRITGGFFYGNGKAGAIPLLLFEKIDGLQIIGVMCDANASSTAENKKIEIGSLCTNVFSTIPEDRVKDVISEFAGTKTGAELYAFIKSTILNVGTFKASGSLAQQGVNPSCEHITHVVINDANVYVRGFKVTGGFAAEEINLLSSTTDTYKGMVVL